MHNSQFIIHNLVTEHSGAVDAACVEHDGLNVIVAAFPYYQRESSNTYLARYARGQDYIEVMRERMERAAVKLREKYPENSFEVLANGSPLPIVQLAVKSGLCIRGRNALAILPPYGSYVFLSAIVVVGAANCHSCNACLDTCPTGALEYDPDKGTRLDRTKCLSFISQDKNATEEQLQLLKLSPTIWGCDLCQTCCPYNADPQESPYPEFKPAETPNIRRPLLLERNKKYMEDSQ